MIRALMYVLLRAFITVALMPLLTLAIIMVTIEATKKQRASEK